MKSPLVILILGALAAAASFLLVARLGSSNPPSASHVHSHAADPSGVPAATPTSHRHADHAATDADLHWLATEFHLDAAAFERVSNLHAEYRPRCDELCRRIDDHNRRLNQALLGAREITPELLQLIEEGASVRAACHTALARHLLQVANCMPSEQGRRYLQLMLPATGITAASHPISEFTHAKPRE